MDEMDEVDSAGLGIFIATFFCTFGVGACFFCFVWHVRSRYCNREAAEEDLENPHRMPQTKDIIAKFDELCPPTLYSKSTQATDEDKALDEKPGGAVWPRCFGLSQSKQEKPCTKVSDCDSEQCVCSICLGEFELKDSVRRLQCSHLFHKACVDKWLLARQGRRSSDSPKGCPMCRHWILADNEIAPEELVRILGVWARSDGTIVARIDKDHLFWSRFSGKTIYTLRNNLINIQLGGQSFRGLVGDGQINWCDGDTWYIAGVTSDQALLIQTQLPILPSYSYRPVETE